jgi:hypothetical protein
MAFLVIHLFDFLPIYLSLDPELKDDLVTIIEKLLADKTIVRFFVQISFELTRIKVSNLTVSGW